MKNFSGGKELTQITKCMRQEGLISGLGGSVVECWTRDGGVAGSSLTDGTVLCP